MSFIVIKHEITLSEDTLAALREIAAQFARATLPAATERPGPHQHTADDRRAFTAADVVSAGEAEGSRDSGRVAGAAAESNAEKPDAPHDVRNHVVTSAGFNTNPAPISEAPPSLEPIPVARGGSEAPAPAAEPPTRPAAGAIEPWHTSARKSVLNRMFPTTAAPGEILRALAEMEGPPLPRWEIIYGYAYTVLKLRRPKVDTKRPAPPQNLGPNRLAAALKLPDKPIDTSEPIVADLGQIIAWGAARGITVHSEADLAAVNETARRIGHRPFRLEAPRRQPVRA